jgi:hypothetical protein
MDNVLREIFVKFPNSLTPETHTIISYLEDYADKIPRGFWKLKPIVKTRESEHNLMISALKELGEDLGYIVFVGQKGAKYNGKSLTNDNKDFKLKTPVLPEVLDRIREIDVLWLDGSKIVYSFDVESTTTITSAVIRGTNIPTKDTMRVIVIPPEREDELLRRITEPALKNAIESNKWGIMLFGELEEISKTKKKKIDPADVDGLISSFSALTSRKKKAAQSTLKKFT